MSATPGVQALISYSRNAWKKLLESPTARRIIDLEPEIYPILTFLLLSAIITAIRVSISLCTKAWRKRHPEPPTRPRRRSSSAYPPGMQVDALLKKWETQGMDPPFVMEGNRRPHRDVEGLGNGLRRR
ncbi:hypothetical protein BU26DRAFT_509810 [Trematosphaeria pertusa]|uniref:Uncharacterized protein n=1 Tax=Trematosphaeria pertusa TaxID=390896 RepID=A0A6A6I053_9PLEO|nr:uncharacterized protein BU26DRAFT_509810 [Trematosphaeria pertusa]KAF2243273.1 hypothetical protein BU26DRAFT_509810 [Trematosphaeria pertusa]